MFAWQNLSSLMGTYFHNTCARRFLLCRKVWTRFTTASFAWSLYIHILCKVCTTLFTRLGKGPPPHICAPNQRCELKRDPGPPVGEPVSLYNLPNGLQIHSTCLHLPIKVGKRLRDVLQNFQPFVTPSEGWGWQNTLRHVAQFYTSFNPLSRLRTALLEDAGPFAGALHTR